MPIDIYPAIDLRHGQVVRLKLGDPERQTTFSQDPLEVAERWLAAGASWLHVVNLDGAFAEAGLRNWQVLPRLVAACMHGGASIQFGGGLRSLSDIESALDLGLTRVILGTIAVEQPALVAEAISRFGSSHIAVGIDARDGKVQTRGWQNESASDPISLGRQMRGLGVRTIIYTDISRDGILTGINADGTIELARQTGLDIIASGGVATLADVHRIRTAAALRKPGGDGVSGLIIGRALYEGKIDLRAALAAAAEDNTVAEVSIPRFKE